MINIIIALTALMYWYVTKDVLPAALGGVLAIMILDEVWLLSVAIAAAIIILCTYYFWAEIIMHLDKELIPKHMGVTLMYMTVVLLKVTKPFR